MSITNLRFIDTLINNQISGYEKHIEELGDLYINEDTYTYTEILTEQIAALQTFKTSLINFIQEANKLNGKS